MVRNDNVPKELVEEGESKTEIRTEVIDVQEGMETLSVAAEGNWKSEDSDTEAEPKNSELVQDVDDRMESKRKQGRTRQNKTSTTHRGRQRLCANFLQTHQELIAAAYCRYFLPCLLLMFQNRVQCRLLYFSCQYRIQDREEAEAKRPTAEVDVECLVEEVETEHTAEEALAKCLAEEAEVKLLPEEADTKHPVKAAKAKRCWILQIVKAYCC